MPTQARRASAPARPSANHAPAGSDPQPGRAGGALCWPRPAAAGHRVCGGLRGPAGQAACGRLCALERRLLGSVSRLQEVPMPLLARPLPTRPDRQPRSRCGSRDRPMTAAPQRRARMTGSARAAVLAVALGAVRFGLACPHERDQLLRAEASRVFTAPTGQVPSGVGHGNSTPRVSHGAHKGPSCGIEVSEHVSYASRRVRPG